MMTLTIYTTDGRSYERVEGEIGIERAVKAGAGSVVTLDGPSQTIIINAEQITSVVVDRGNGSAL